MRFLLDGIAQAWQLIVSGDPYLWHLVLVTMQVAAAATVAGLVIGLPVGLVIGIGRFRGRQAALVFANAGLGLPPVVVGLVLFLVLYPSAPLGFLRLIYTLNGVYVAQAILAIPVVIALTASAVRAIPDGLLDQARAFGASRVQVALLALREARIGVLAAIIAAVGTAFSEVGAVVIVGGNVEGYDETLASAALSRTGSGQYTLAVAIAIVLIALVLLVAAVLTVLQYWDGRTRGRKTA